MMVLGFSQLFTQLIHDKAVGIWEINFLAHVEDQFLGLQFPVWQMWLQLFPKRCIYMFGHKRDLATVLRTPNSPKTVFVALICISLTMRWSVHPAKHERLLAVLLWPCSLWPSLNGSLHRSTCWRVRTHSSSLLHWGKFSVSRGLRGWRITGSENH